MFRGRIGPITYGRCCKCGHHYDVELMKTTERGVCCCLCLQLALQRDINDLRAKRKDEAK